MKHAHHRFDPGTFRVAPGKPFRIADRDTSAGDELGGKKEAAEALAADVSQLRDAQQRLYADGTRAILIVLQGMDAAGKDGLIRHVMGGINPQGCRVESFKAPDAEELRHHFLWRPMRFLPQRGMIAIFNRSYYEEVLVVRVHPEILAAQKLPERLVTPDIWTQRLEDIRAFERYLTRNGVVIRKFFLHVSREEQKKRFLARLDEPERNWKFSPSDARERAHWDEYMAAHEDAIRRTATPEAPWHVVPADSKWFTRLVVASVLIDTLASLDLAYPKVSARQKAELAEARRLLVSEDGRARGRRKR